VSANVVSGAVTAGYYRIGILKSIGFTPGRRDHRGARSAGRRSWR